MNDEISRGDQSPVDRDFTHRSKFLAGPQYIFTPRELWDRPCIKPHLHDILEHFYFCTGLSSKVWRVLESSYYARKRYHDPSEIKTILCQKTPQKVISLSGVSHKKCWWCRAETYLLHDHHYPIPKKEGGDNTVSICASCHSEYHFLDSSYDFTDAFLNLFPAEVLNGST